MIDSQREKLFNWTNAYICVGISGTGEPYRSYAVPWDSTVNAYNMKLPDVYIAGEDLSDPQIMSKIGEFTVLGCYIFCPLTDYAFLHTFPRLKDLNIFDAYNLNSLSFLKDVKDCNLLFLAKAHLPNLDDVIVPKESFWDTNPRNLALFDCVVDDIEALKKANRRFHELIICNPKTRDERARWKTIRGARYYDMRE